MRERIATWMRDTLEMLEMLGILAGLGLVLDAVIIGTIAIVQRMGD